MRPPGFVSKMREAILAKRWNAFTLLRSKFVQQDEEEGLSVIVQRRGLGEG